MALVAGWVVDHLEEVLADLEDEIEVFVRDPSCAGACVVGDQ